MNAWNKQNTLSVIGKNDKVLENTGKQAVRRGRELGGKEIKRTK